MNDLNDFITPPGHIHFLAKKLFADCGEIMNGSIAYLEPKGGGPVHPHTHPGHDHLFIVVSGEAKAIVGEEEKIIRANESLRIAGKTPHSVWNHAEDTTVMIGISIKATDNPNI